MISSFIPGLIMIITSFLLPTIPQYFRHPAMLLSVGLSALSLFNGYGTFLEWDILGLNFFMISLFQFVFLFKYQSTPCR